MSYVGSDKCVCSNTESAATSLFTCSYNAHFRLQASFRWHGGTVASMLYNAVYDELITAGKAGVKVWYCEPDYKAFAKNAAAPLRSGARSSPLSGFAPTSMSKLKGGRAPPWQLGAFQSIRERITFRLDPGEQAKR